MSQRYSQTSRDRMVANMLIAMPVIAALLLIRFYQTRQGRALTP
jgi:hypothetical protein